MRATRSPERNPAPASSAATWFPRTASWPAVTGSAGSPPFSKTSTTRSGSRAAWPRTTRLMTAASSRLSMAFSLFVSMDGGSVPVGHVVADLGGGRLPAVELVVERLVDVVGDERQVALHRV